MNEDIVNITKKPGVKNCVRISKVEDVPEFLKEVVRVEGDTLVLDCIEGEERVPVGSVIAYEKLDSGKMNVWNKANWKETTIEVDGVFYEVPKRNRAIRVTEQMPDFVISGLGDRFKQLPDGSFQIDTGWGLATCAPYKGYMIIYGQKEDGTLDANFINKETPSFRQYYVVDEQGNITQSLEEYDRQFEENVSNGLV